MERLTARSPQNGLAYLVNVRPDEQAVDSAYPDTLRCILEAFNRLAELEDVACDRCEWTSSDEHDGCIVWVSSCGNVHILEAGGPDNNEMNFCCYCGKPLFENDVLKSREADDEAQG